MKKRIVCRVGDVPADGLKECDAGGGVKLLVASSAGEFFGYQPNCPHQDIPLCEGIYDGSTLICHQHLWQWDIRTGEPMGLAESALKKIPIHVEGGSIYLSDEQ